MSRAPRNLRLEQPPFRLRALTLALAAAGIGVLTFISAYEGCKNPKRAVVPVSASSTSSAWPEGFVEWQDVPSASASGAVVPSAPSRR